jgi:hypothetical protein
LCDGKSCVMDYQGSGTSCVMVQVV